MPDETKDTQPRNCIKDQSSEEMRSGFAHFEKMRARYSRLSTSGLRESKLFLIESNPALMRVRSIYDP